jgi:hypothetical protein
MGVVNKIALSIACVFLLGSCVRAAAEGLFDVNRLPLESACLSDNEHIRMTCVDHIQHLLAEYNDADELRASNPFVGCYYGELLTLRNVGVQGYRQILEALEWAATLDGRAQTASYPELLRASQDFYLRIEPARVAIRDARQSGLRRSCRLSFALTRQRLYW